MPGKLVIFSAPSGSGKTTLVKNLLSFYPSLGFSTSATTRKPREGEVDGKDYYFLSAEKFKQRIANDEFAEYEEVYEGRYYGTLKLEIERLWSQGKDVIFDVDVKGGISLKKIYKEKAISIFVKVPSIEVLENRLRSRGTETEKNLQMRLAKVKEEMMYESKFDVSILNDDLLLAVERAKNELDKFLR